MWRKVVQYVCRRIMPVFKGLDFAHILHRGSVSRSKGEFDMVPSAYNISTRITALFLVLAFLFLLLVPVAFAAPVSDDFSREATASITGDNSSSSNSADSWELTSGELIDRAGEQRKSAELAENGEFTPLPIDASGVDPKRIVAWPKEDTSTEEVEESVLELAATIDALENTEILVNPEEGDLETLVVIESDAAATEELIDEMMASGLYEAVDFDVLVEPMAGYVSNPNDPYFADRTDPIDMWGLKTFPGANFSNLWARLGLARGNANTAAIAVIDTGFDMTAEDRGANIVGVYDFGSMRVNVSPQSSASLAYHGTGTASVIGAVANNKKGITGAAWDNQVVIYKAADENNALYLSAVANSINDVVEKRNARIINMSLGGTALPNFMKEAIDRAVAADILVIASAGNNALVGNPVLYPAAYPPVLSVAALSPTGQRADFSTYNSGVDIAAPGELIAVMSRNNTYSYSSGTSFAAPHVASAAALVWRANPELSAMQVEKILLDTARPIGTRGNPKTGAGALDARAAFETALGLPFQPTITKVERAEGSVKLTWARDTECTVASSAYILQYRAYNEDTWTPIKVMTTAKSHSYTVRGLQENKKYYFRVATVNDNGKGPFSAVAEGTSYPLSILSSHSVVKVKKGSSVTIRVAPHYCTKMNVKMNWSSSKPKIASVSTTGNAALKQGKGSWKASTLTGKNVQKGGKKITIKGKTKGTSYLTFSSGYAKYKVKVVVQ